MNNPPSCCHSSVTPKHLDSVSLKCWSCRQDHGKYEALQKVNRLGTVGGEKRQLAMVFFPWKSSQMASTHFQARLWQFLCFRLTVFTHSSLFGEKGCNSMSQNSSCRYCNNNILAFRSDLSRDLVHHTKKLVLAEKQTQKPQEHECSEADRPTAAEPTRRHLSSDPGRLPGKSWGCNHMPAPGTWKLYLKILGKNSWCFKR